MLENESARHLAELRVEANRSLRGLLRSVTPPAPSSREPDAEGGGHGLSEGVPSAGPGRTGAPGDVVVVNVNLKGETIFLDDERRIRALAKTIKRLITEDRRRGLGVGG